MSLSDFEFPEGFRDPVAAEDLPHIVAYDPDEPDPVPPAERIAEAEAEGKETKAAQVGHFAGGDPA